VHGRHGRLPRGLWHDHDAVRYGSRAADSGGLDLDDAGFANLADAKDASIGHAESAEEGAILGREVGGVKTGLVTGCQLGQPHRSRIRHCTQTLGRLGHVTSNRSARRQY